MNKKKKKLVLYDSLTKESKEKDITIWTGEKGKYIFKSFGEIKAKKPISQVYLNRSYLTGIFKSKISGQYTGDIKEIDKKRYLLFKVVNDKKIDIFEKVEGSKYKKNA